MHGATQTGDAEQDHERPGDQRKCRQQHRPVALKHLPRPVEKLIGLIAAQPQRRGDRDQRQDEAEVEQHEQRHLPRRTDAGADDRGDRREVGECGRQLDGGDRRPQDRGRSSLGLDLRWITVGEPVAVDPEHHGRDKHRGAGDDLEHVSRRLIRLGHQR